MVSRPLDSTATTSHVIIAWQVRRTSNILSDTLPVNPGDVTCGVQGRLASILCRLTRHKLNVINQRFARGAWRPGVCPDVLPVQIGWGRPAITSSFPEVGAFLKSGKVLPNAGEIALD